MRVYHIQVFDDIISGTASTWYSNADHNFALGSADWIVVGAVPTSVTGTSPTLTVQVEHSGDGIIWSSLSPNVINAASLVNGTLRSGEMGGNLVLLSHVRLKITLGGTSPQCRLKVYVTGRARGRLAGASAA